MSTLSNRPSPSSTQLSQLSSRGVPIESLLEACKACSEDCDDNEDVDPYPKGFDVDMESDMLGSFGGFARQVVISTGKRDWDREVTDSPNSLAQLLRDEYASTTTSESSKPSFLNNLARKFSSNLSLSSQSSQNDEPIPGVHPSIVRDERTTSKTLSVLNSSFVSNSHEGHRESVMVFPDYRIVHDVEAKKEHAKEMVERYLSVDNEGRRIGESSEGSQLKSWPLPYRAVILLCSHKKRDRRCHLAAPLLASQFHHHLERHDLHVDERGEDLEHELPIEDWIGTAEEKEKELEEKLRGNQEGSERVGMFMISHIGGHKFSGNVVIQFPNGTCIYYGRVTPADVGVIVDRTIMQGKIIPEFLRGGLGIDGKNGAKGILDW
ncbi:sucrase/ferredoxin-like domain-containing protein [Sporobolomyces salmoneus]|uniref:sucrase/ferredoxin-like domain-containing protein n=1 Tax=Sporobolomyces salmoneus TaxID=183962 RepID=UPI00316DCA76